MSELRLIGRLVGEKCVIEPRDGGCESESPEFVLSVDAFEICSGAFKEPVSVVEERETASALWVPL